MYQVNEHVSFKTKRKAPAGDAQKLRRRGDDDDDDDDDELELRTACVQDFGAEGTTVLTSLSKVIAVEARLQSRESQCLRVLCSPRCETPVL
jgi:hypothetical protein